MLHRRSDLGSPRLPGDNLADCALRDSELASHRRLPVQNMARNVSGSNLGNQFCREPSLPILRAGRSSMPYGSVSHIVRLSPGQQVGRVTARRVVARVPNCRREVPVGKKESNSTRNRRMRLSGPRHLAVVRVIATSHPRPACVWTAGPIYSGPEPIDVFMSGGILSLRLRFAFLRAKVPIPSSYLTSVVGRGVTTNLARQLNHLAWVAGVIWHRFWQEGPPESCSPVVLDYTTYTGRSRVIAEHTERISDSKRDNADAA